MRVFTTALGLTLAKITDFEIGKKYLRDRKELEEQYKEHYDKLTKIDDPESFKEPRD